MKSFLDTLTPGSEDWILATALNAERMPRHIAVIMDGNGRWAKQRRLPRVAGHKAGVESVRVTVESCARLGVEALTLYAFSTENWKRPALEVQTLWRLLRIYLRQELKTLMENNVRLAAIGRVHALPEKARAELDRVIALTANNTGMQLNLALNYSGRAELADTLNAIVQKARAFGNLDTLHISEELIEANLETAGLPDPDLLIRTSGEMRISNFLLWQIAYSELYVTQTYWPDFRRGHLLEALLDYQKRERRFGGVGDESAERLTPHTAPELGLPVR